MRTSALEPVRVAHLPGLEIEPTGLPQRGGLEIDPNGHAGYDIDAVGMGMEIDPNGAPWLSPGVHAAGTIHGGGLDIEPNG